jgi:hypothetical protein
MEKVAKNGRKVKAIIACGLTFLLFFATFSKMKKVAKMDEKLRL